MALLPLELRRGPLRIAPHRALLPLAVSAVIAGMLLTWLVSVVPGVLTQSSDIDHRNAVLRMNEFRTGLVQLGEESIFLIYDPNAAQPHGSPALRDAVEHGDSQVALLVSSLTADALKPIDADLVVRPSEYVLLTNSPAAQKLVSESSAGLDTSAPSAAFEVAFAAILILLPTFYVVGSGVIFSVVFREEELALLRLLGVDPRRVRRLVAVQAAMTALLGTLAAVVAHHLILRVVDDITIGPFDFTSAQLQLPISIAILIPSAICLLAYASAFRAMKDVSANPLGVSVGSQAEKAVRPVNFAGLLIGLALVYFGANSLRSGVSATSTLLITAGLVLSAAAVVGSSAVMLGGAHLFPLADPSHRWALRRLQRHPRASLRPAAGTLVGIVLTAFVSTAAFSSPPTRQPDLSLLRIQTDESDATRLLDEVRQVSGVVNVEVISYGYALINRSNAFQLLVGSCEALNMLSGASRPACEVGQVWSTSSATTRSIGKVTSTVDLRRAAAQYTNIFDGTYVVGGHLTSIADSVDSLFLISDNRDDTERFELIVESSGGLETFLTISERFTTTDSREVLSSVIPVGASSSYEASIKARNMQLLLLGTTGSLIVSSLGLIIHAVTVRWTGAREFRLIRTLGASPKRIRSSMWLLTVAPIVIGIGTAVLSGILLGALFNLGVARESSASLPSLTQLGVALVASVFVGMGCAHLLAGTVTAAPERPAE